MALKYTKKTLENFLNPKNIGRLDEPDGYAQIGNLVCGDQLDFFLKVEKGVIKEAKFLSFGCASNIATASVMTQKIKGMKVEDAKKYAWESIVDYLGGLPRQKLHCSVMAVEGLRKAIADYEKRQAKAETVKQAKTVKKAKKPVKTKMTKSIKTTKKAKTVKLVKNKIKNKKK